MDKELPAVEVADSRSRMPGLFAQHGMCDFGLAFVAQLLVKQVTAQLPEELIDRIKTRFPIEKVTDILLRLLLSEKKLSLALYELNGHVMTRICIELHTCKQDVIHLAAALNSLAS